MLLYCFACCKSSGPYSSHSDYNIDNNLQGVPKKRKIWKWVHTYYDQTFKQFRQVCIMFHKKNFAWTYNGAEKLNITVYLDPRDQSTK